MHSEAIELDLLLPLAADVILLLHVLFVGFVVLGLALIAAGGLFGWSWVRNPWFRLVHVVAIGIVVVQSWFGAICPLTIWEMALRSQAEGATYTGTFISYWLGRMLYYQNFNGDLTLNLEDFPNTTLIIKLIHEKGFYSKKIINTN